MYPFLSFLSAETMPDRAFSTKGWISMGAILVSLAVNMRQPFPSLREIGKSQLLHFQIAFQVVDILLQGDKGLFGMIQVQADQLCEPGQIAGRIPVIVLKNHFPDAVERIEDEMWVHLGVKGLHLIFSNLRVEAEFLAYLPHATPVNAQDGQRHDQTDHYEEPLAPPIGWRNQQDQVLYLLRPAVASRKKLYPDMVLAWRQVIKIHAALPVQQMPGRVGSGHYPIGETVSFRVDKIDGIKTHLGKTIGVSPVRRYPYYPVVPGQPY